MIISFRLAATSSAHRPVELRQTATSPSFDVDKMTYLLDHDNHEMRSDFRRYLCVDDMVPKYNIPLLEERDMALKRLKRICDAGYISVLDFR